MSASYLGSRSGGQQSATAPPALGAEGTWPWLYRIAGAAAVISILMIGVAIVVYSFSPPPSTVLGSFAQFRANRLVGLIDLDLPMLIDSVLMIPIFLALYAALRRSHEAFVTLGTTLGLVGIGVYLTSNPCFSMLALSDQYGAATSDAQRAAILAAGQVMLTIWQGTAYDVSYVMGGIAGLILALVMLRSDIFGRATAWVGIVLNALMLVPPTVGPIGLVLSFLSLVPLAIWYVLVARRLFQLGAVASPTEAPDSVAP
jgi:hypothetical protein